MSYEEHNSNQCDKCGKEVGYENLEDFPFLFLDCDDVGHKDKGNGYRQYKGCKDCIAMEKKINEHMKKRN